MTDWGQRLQGQGGGGIVVSLDSGGTPPGGFTFGPSRTVKCGGCSPPHLMWEVPTRGPGVPAHRVSQSSGAGVRLWYCALSVCAWGGGGGGWHKALGVGSVSLWRRLLASRP